MGIHKTFHYSSALARLHIELLLTKRHERRAAE
jgi:hypothetical protein